MSQQDTNIQPDAPETKTANALTALLTLPLKAIKLMLNMTTSFWEYLPAVFILVLLFTFYTYKNHPDFVDFAVKKTSQLFDTQLTQPTPLAELLQKLGLQNLQNVLGIPANLPLLPNQPNTNQASVTTPWGTLTDNSKVKVTFDTTPTTIFYCEVAVSTTKQQLGLTTKDKLEPNECMLFAYSQASTVPFWTKNMKFPIDILFLDKNLTIMQIFTNIPPCQQAPCPAYSPEKPYYFAIELPGGAVKKHGITTQTPVSLKIVN